MKLNHLWFADDVIMCCRGDYASVYTMLQSFQHFSEATGLEVNKHKIEVYTTGMKRDEVQRILDVSGFSSGTLPFKYLGVSICFKRISSKDCNIVIEKMMGRIRT